LTELGAEQAERGTPESRILSHVKKNGPVSLPDLAAALGLENKDIGSAFGALSKDGALAMDAEKRVSLSDESKTVRLRMVEALLMRARTAVAPLAASDLSPADQELMNGMARKRGAAGSPFRQIEREEVVYTVEPAAGEVAAALKAAGVTGEELGALTPDMLARGGWKNRVFRPFNINSPATRVHMGRTNPYCDYLRSVKDKLSSLGFEEFDGPLVETEFWNSDALFMPQFHSARDIHDVYHIKTPTHAREIEQPYLDQVAGAHENGWKTGSRGWEYSFDREFTRRLILRSQGTVLSAKTLPKARVPGKYFGIVRCFRYDQVDATHLSDFYQTEGIVLGENANLRNLLGLLKMFAGELAGASEIKYVPGYFPFTEPSVEVHIKHPVLGWFELGGSGIFRPEVTRPLGIDVPVLAWGLGIDRMALMHLGLNDLRELFSGNIENVRLRRSS
jgi:phenylalanyl-tRNA synthetase alpha chain